MKAIRPGLEDGYADRSRRSASLLGRPPPRGATARLTGAGAVPFPRRGPARPAPGPASEADGDGSPCDDQPRLAGRLAPAPQHPGRETGPGDTHLRRTRRTAAPHRTDRTAPGRTDHRSERPRAGAREGAHG